MAIDTGYVIYSHSPSPGKYSHFAHVHNKLTDGQGRSEKKGSVTSKKSLRDAISTSTVSKNDAKTDFGSSVVF